MENTLKLAVFSLKVYSVHGWLEDCGRWGFEMVDDGKEFFNLKYFHKKKLSIIGSTLEFYSLSQLERN